MKTDCNRYFDGFPGIFRRSIRRNPETHQHFYALQARYAQREGGDVSDPEQESYIVPLASDKLNVVIDFILKMAEQETKEADQALSRRSSFRTNLIAITAAILSAIAAVTAATIKQEPQKPPSSVQSSPSIASPPAAPTPR